jgi:putative ATPase
MLQAGRLTNLIFCGPPGSGKTTLATLIARSINAAFKAVSGPSTSVAELRQVLAEARQRLAMEAVRTILFMDEIHRFNKAQQDVLLEPTESGLLILIGATTENPYFALNSPLLSRSTVLRFEPLSADDLVKIMQRAIQDRTRGLGMYKVMADQEALEYIATAADGDARAALTALEIAVLSALGPNQDQPVHVDLDLARQCMQHKHVLYDPTGDSHYDLASALQKSMRGSDPDATVYWLARMIVGGEDLRFIARRIAVCAAEDVGNADPMATVLAAAAIQVTEFVGPPEAYLALAQAAIYVACASKSNACAVAIWQAMEDVKTRPLRPVPAHLLDRHSTAGRTGGHGEGYKYPHDYPGAAVRQEYLSGPPVSYYRPTDRGHERVMAEYLQRFRALLEEGPGIAQRNDDGKGQTT